MHDTSGYPKHLHRCTSDLTWNVNIGGLQACNFCFKLSWPGCYIEKARSAGTRHRVHAMEDTGGKELSCNTLASHRTSTGATMLQSGGQAWSSLRTASASSCSSFPVGERSGMHAGRWLRLQKMECMSDCIEQTRLTESCGMTLRKPAW